MGLFSKEQEPSTPAAAAVNLRKPGTIDLSKGGAINLAKADAGSKVTLTCLWPDTTDYDLYAQADCHRHSLRW